MRISLCRHYHVMLQEFPFFFFLLKIEEMVRLSEPSRTCAQVRKLSAILHSRYPANDQKLNGSSRRGESVKWRV